MKFSNHGIVDSEDNIYEIKLILYVFDHFYSYTLISE